MGVKGLWRLLLPIGRRISVETLEGRTLAIDASIWLTQFLKANRDPDSGAVRPGAHLIGFLRRICKLLFHGIRPVFVFDGATPEIKLREIRARRERRERMTIGVGAGGEDEGAIKRMARKILVANLKRAKELEASNKKKKATAGRVSRNTAGVDTSSGAFSSNFNLEDGDQENEDDNGNDYGDDQNKDTLNDQTSTGDVIDLSALDDGAEYSRNHDENENTQPGKYAQNDWDDVNPVALFGSDDRSSPDGSSASIQLPENEEQLDIDAVLSLPAAQRKDVIEKVKRQQRMRSRKEFMPAAADPEAYSQVQLKNFLRSSNLNKKINEMGAKAAKGSGIDGLEGEAIASDATRRFIFVKDTDKKEDKKNVSTGADTSSSAPAAAHAMDESPGSRRRLRRMAGDVDGSDDDNVFCESSRISSKEALVAASSKNMHRAIYSSSEDEDNGGFAVDGDEGPTSSPRGGNPDPKSVNYKSHILKDAKGWTLDESNVFVTNQDDDNISSSDDGGGFIVNEPSTLSKSRHRQSNGNSKQLHEDEVLARALQEVEDEDAVHLGESDAGGYTEVITSSDCTHGRGSTRDTSSGSRIREESDAILAARLQAEEHGHVDRGENGSYTIDLSGDAEVEGEQTREPVVLEDSSASPSDNDSDVFETRPCGKRKRGGAPQKHTPGNDTAPTEDSDDDVEWEDGDTGVGANLGAFHSSLQIASRSSAANVQAEAADESDEDVGWEDGDAQKDKQGEKESLALHKHKTGTSIVLDDDDEKERSFFSSRRSSLSDTDGEIEGDTTNDVFASPAKDANIAALRHAQETAANLTNWAGRAVRRAIAAHMEESGAAGGDAGALRVTAASMSTVPLPPAPDSKVNMYDDDPGGIEDAEKKREVSPKEVGEVESAGRKNGSNEAVQDEAERTEVSRPPIYSTNSSFSDVQASIVQTGSSSRSVGNITAPPAMDTSLEALQREDHQMRDELNKQQRDMDTVTDEMKEEIMQLLQLFGIPYVEAPAEAEAQACTLEALGLVDGVVTEDSDAFVFGGKKVYKNIFDDQKYVEAYFASDAEKDLGLSHNHLVALAMLLGGDYTEGVKGVGIVNGMEVLQAFDVSSDVKGGLTMFRKWLDGFEPTDSVTTRTLAEKEFSNKHRTARTRWSAPKDFPSPSVLTAYQKPVVDKSDSPFSWGVPDALAVHSFCSRKLGWTSEETDRAILPALKALENSGTRQTRLESYFMRYEDGIKFADVRSKRLKSVLNKVRSDCAHDDASNPQGPETEDQGDIEGKKANGRRKETARSTSKDKDGSKKRKPGAVSTSGEKSKKTRVGRDQGDGMA